MKSSLGQKIKLGFWTISAIIIGVFLTSLVFKNSDTKGIILIKNQAGYASMISVSKLTTATVAGK